MKTKTIVGKEASDFMNAHHIGNDVVGGRHVGKGAYVLDETINGLPLQLNGKNVGYATNMAQLLLFLRKVGVVVVPIETKTEPVVKNVFAQEEPRSVWQSVYCWTVGILNPQDLKTKRVAKIAIAVADPERRAKLKFKDYPHAQRLAELGARWEDISVAEHIRRRTLYYRNRNQLVAEYLRTGSLHNTIYNVLAEYTE